MLAIAPRNNNARISNASGSHALAPATLAKQKQKKTMNKYTRCAMTAPQNRGPKIGSPTLQMSRMTSRSSSCNKSEEEEKDRIFKELKPNGLGESNLL